MSKSRKDQRKHRKKVAGTAAGADEHRKRDQRRGTKRPRTETFGKEKR